MKKCNTKEVILVVTVAIAVIVVGSGCTFTNLFDRKPIRLGEPYKYYVIDTNADVPDAYFKTLDEASIYQKEFAAYHEYVIVKMEGKYNVYNMEPIENDTQTVQKSE